MINKSTNPFANLGNHIAKIFGGKYWYLCGWVLHSLNDCVCTHPNNIRAIMVSCWDCNVYIFALPLQTNLNLLSPCYAGLELLYSRYILSINCQYPIPLFNTSFL